MKEFTMQRIREMKPYTLSELIIYARATEVYAQRVSAFESHRPIDGKPCDKHEGLVSFKECLKQAKKLVKTNT